jgi:hypothetical protein
MVVNRLECLDIQVLMNHRFNGYIDIFQTIRIFLGSRLETHISHIQRSINNGWGHIDFYRFSDRFSKLLDFSRFRPKLRLTNTIRFDLILETRLDNMNDQCISQLFSTILYYQSISEDQIYFYVS